MGLFLFILLWFLLFGSAIGSFLNVVIYRMPRGENLSFPPSHCPRCKHPIRWFDNIPVFGWLLLRGKCRDCKQPIAWRYPAVEAICAGLFGLLWAAAFFNGAFSLGEALGYSGYHLVLLITLFAAGMIEFDGNAVPARLFVVSFFVGFLFPWEFLHLHPIGFDAPEPLKDFWKSAHFSNAEWEAAGNGLTAVLGAVGGLVFGIATCWLLPAIQRREWVFALAASGLFWGWQIALIAGGVVLVFCGIGRLFAIRSVPCFILCVILLLPPLLPLISKIVL